MMTFSLAKIRTRSFLPILIERFKKKKGRRYLMSWCLERIQLPLNNHDKFSKILNFRLHLISLSLPTTISISCCHRSPGWLQPPPNWPEYPLPSLFSKPRFTPKSRDFGIYKSNCLVIPAPSWQPLPSHQRTDMYGNPSLRRSSPTFPSWTPHHPIPPQSPLLRPLPWLQCLRKGPQQGSEGFSGSCLMFFCATTRFMPVSPHSLWETQEDCLLTTVSPELCSLPDIILILNIYYTGNLSMPNPMEMTKGLEDWVQDRLQSWKPKKVHYSHKWVQGFYPFCLERKIKVKDRPNHRGARERQPE